MAKLPLVAVAELYAFLKGTKPALLEFDADQFFSLEDAVKSAFKSITEDREKDKTAGKTFSEVSKISPVHAC